jgi:hypothetical protein
MNISEEFKLKKAVPKVQVQCSNCKGYKTISDSRKYHTMAMGGVLFLFGVILNLFLMLILGIPLMIVGFIIMLIAQNTMKDDGSMECRNCKSKFKTGVIRN